VDLLSPKVTNKKIRPSWKREREEKVREGGSERHYSVGVVEGNNIGGFEGSQPVPASPSGRGEASMRDLFNFSRSWSGCNGVKYNLTLGALYYGEKF
jgi:hypothetical protein